LEARKSPKKLRRERKGEGKGVARDGITDTTDIPPQIEGLVINGESIGKLLEDDGGLSEMNASAKKYASEAIDVMADIMRDRFARPADRLNAANMILEKAYGKTPAKGGHGESRVPSVIVLPAFNISVGTGTRANHDEPRRIGKGESITIDTESITGIQCDSDTDEPIN
jgi:hypothetical protein